MSYENNLLVITPGDQVIITYDPHSVLAVGGVRNAITATGASAHFVPVLRGGHPPLQVFLVVRPSASQT